MTSNLLGEMLLFGVEKIEMLSSPVKLCEMLLIFVILIGGDLTSEPLNVWLDFGFCWAAGPAPHLPYKWFKKAIKQVFQGPFKKPGLKCFHGQLISSPHT